MSSSSARSVIRQYRFVATQPMPIPIPEPQPAEPVKAEEEVPAVDPALEIQNLMAMAQAEAERIKAEATRDAQAIRQQAEASGRQQGFETGCSEGRALLAATVKQETDYLQQLADGVLRERTSLLAQAESQLIDLSLAISRKLIGDLANEHVEVLAEMCHRAIEQLGQSVNLRVQVHPSDAQRLAEYWAKDAQPALELVADERVPQGGCLVTSGASTIDARLDTQFDLIQQTFAGLQGNT